MMNALGMMLTARRGAVRTITALLSAATILFGAGCTSTETRQRTDVPVVVREVASPASPGSGQPELSVATDGEVILSWVEKVGERRHRLRFATLDGEGWSAPRDVAEGDNWFINWADFGSVVKLADGAYAAHWLVRSSLGKYSYDIRIARSSDGVTWGPPVTPHRDGTATEHGFVSLVPLSGGKLGAIWLDGRKYAKDEHATNFAGDARMVKTLHGHGGAHDSHAAAGDAATNEMTLRYATIKSDGSLADEAELDDRVCDCCQTTAALTAEGLVVIYRDRADDEVRDFYVVRQTATGWSEPRPLHRDGWQISACPVNGASVAAHGRTVAVAWYTAADDRPRVLAAFSDDAGATFGAAVEVAAGDTEGRVDVVLLDDGDALVSWLSLEGATMPAIIKARRVRADGTRGTPLDIAATAAKRASGFPRSARVGDGVVFAWTSTEEKPARVRVGATVTPHLTR